jgi:hypothetical protein
LGARGKKILLALLPQKKKTGPLMSLLVGCMKLFFPKLLVTIFGVG